MPNKKLRKQVQANGFPYTVTNYTDDDIASCMALFEDDVNAKYQIIGFEECPRTGTRHIQGYIYYTNKVSLSVMKKHPGRPVTPWHIEQQGAKFNVAAYVYCMEDRDYYEQGDRPRQGHRTDLEVIKHDLLSGRPMKDIALQYFSQWCQYRRAFNEFLELERVHYDTRLAYYDVKNAVSHMREINRTYKDHYLVTSEYVNYLELCKMISSGQYTVIFLPNTTFYMDYNLTIDFTID